MQLTQQWDKTFPKSDKVDQRKVTFKNQWPLSTIRRSSWTRRDVEAGRGLYMRCMGCHGRDLVSAGGPAPDLRESPIAFDPEALWSVVHEGALLERGMPRYASLTREQVMQIYAYIRAGARQAAAAQGAGGD